MLITCLASMLTSPLSSRSVKKISLLELVLKVVLKPIFKFGINKEKYFREKIKPHFLSIYCLRYGEYVDKSLVLMFIIRLINMSTNVKNASVLKETPIII